VVKCAASSACWHALLNFASTRKAFRFSNIAVTAETLVTEEPGVTKGLVQMGFCLVLGVM